MSEKFIQLPSSYRDSSGFMFTISGNLYRQVNLSFKEDWNHFIDSGLYSKLAAEQLLIPHEVINQNLTGNTDWYKTLLPEKIKLITYPWEWSFDMLKDAALLTLKLAREAVTYDMLLKDATPYNIQFHKGKMIFIDTLSFEKSKYDQPWVAYRQFCENFLAPLLLMHHTKNSFHELSLAYPEGIPLAVVKSLLPWTTKFSLHIYLHIHLHAKLTAGANNKKLGTKFSKQKFLNLLTSLEIAIKKLKSYTKRTAWSHYYQEASLRSNYVEHKKQIIQKWLEGIQAVEKAADLGANDGEFAKLLANKGIDTIAADIDPICINRLYNQCRETGKQKIQPLIIDIANPSPAIGFNNDERLSFTARVKVDLVLALALVHHLAIGKNVPLEMIARFFSEISPKLIIEFIPIDDEKVQLMLVNKKHIYTNYTKDEFEKAFTVYFSIKEKEQVASTNRILYLMERNNK
jgi:hypothetical protein